MKQVARIERYVCNFVPMFPGKNIKLNSLRQQPAALYRYCLAAIFCLSFFGQFSLYVLLNNGQQVTVHEKISFSDPAHQAAHNPFGQPFALEPNSSEELENEPDAGSDPVQSLGLFSIRHEEHVRCSTEKSSCSSYLSSLQTRKTVSLIILYHSWKSFLS